jgi:hypothetical protein
MAFSLWAREEVLAHEKRAPAVNAQTHTAHLILDRIFHPSDFSPASEVAFAHALKLALIARTRLRVMHVALRKDDMHWSDFPGVRATLA